MLKIDMVDGKMCNRQLCNRQLLEAYKYASKVSKPFMQKG